jgi:hypothetical protein
MTRKVIKIYLSPQFQRLLLDLSTLLSQNENDVLIEALKKGLLILAEKNNIQARV